MLKEFRSLFDFIVDNLSSKGFQTVQEKLKTKRLEVCKTCSSYTGKRCKECGCAMKVKAKFISAKCPRDLWDE